MIDYQELKRLAEAATPGRVHDRLDSCGGGLKYECFGDDGSLVLKVDHKNDEWGFIGDRGAEDEAFFLACTPAAVLALVAEVEALRESATFKAVQNLRADCEDLRKDAERYRWLIHNAEEIYVCSQNLNLDPHYCGKEKLKQEADQVIDLAMQQETK